MTVILNRIAEGDAAATEELWPIVYHELRRLARYRMAQERRKTLQPTALIHETFLRLVKDDEVPWKSRAHFFASAAEAMRRILIERARRRARLRHGGGQHRTSLAEDAVAVEPRPEELLALDRALDHLEAHDRNMAEIVKLRYFAGFTLEETAALLRISRRSVTRLWTGARAWLRLQMSDPGARDLLE